MTLGQRVHVACGSVQSGASVAAALGFAGIQGPELVDALKGNPDLVRQVVQLLLLDAVSPKSQQPSREPWVSVPTDQDVANAVGSAVKAAKRGS